ncbi:MAG: T9SS type A sorting domain-containing protein [Melioribacteraceae bacterium]
MKYFSFVILFLPILIIGQDYTPDEFSRLNQSNISSSYINNGLSDYNFDGVKGFHYPKNNPYTAIWWSGLAIGGKINGEVRLAGTTFKTGMVNSKNILRVRRDFKNGDLTAEINDGEGNEEEIRTKYQTAWSNWDAENGAPFEDVDGNMIYDPEIDIPGIKGAAQTIWFKMDDSNENLIQKTFGSNQLNVDVDLTIWNYVNRPILENIVFRKYTILNKGKENITDLYCGILSNPNIGEGGDDLVGSDSTLNLAYCYNSKAEDEALGNTPYALGYLILDKQDVFFNFFINTDSVYGFPEMGSCSGSLHLYNLMQGKLKDGSRYKIPAQYGGGETSFPLSGDPVSHTGWLDGEEFYPGNRNIGLSAKLNNILYPGERVSIIIAQIAAGGKEGTNNLEAIDTLRNYASYVLSHIADFPVKVIHNFVNEIPESYELLQNYPNPFNPTTSIEYALPIEGNVKLEVYNSIGQLVNVLVKGYQNAGRQRVTWNGKDSFGSLVSSGIYFYCLKTNSFSQVKKMILMK